jgi:hypothetical protein
MMDSPTREEYRKLKGDGKQLLIDNEEWLNLHKETCPGLARVVEETKDHVEEMDAFIREHEQTTDLEKQEELRRQIVKKAEEFSAFVAYRERELNPPNRN